MMTSGTATAAVADQAGIAQAATDAMAATGARGLAVAVIDHGKVVSVQAFGARNEAGDPLTTDTVMYGASLTKTLFAYFVMQLVDEAKVRLDRPIAGYLPRPLPDYGNLDAYGNWGDLAGDERWREITPRMALNHSTGFANFAFLEPDGKLRIHFRPGSRFAYSGEGIELLQFAIEKGLGLDLQAELERRVFKPLAMNHSSLVWHPEFARNLADGWTSAGEAVAHDERSRVRAAGSLDTSISDFSRFAAALASGQGLSADAHRAMIRPGLPITTRQQFPSLAPEVPLSERVASLAAGIGVVTFRGPQGPGFMKGGHNESTGNMLVCLEDGERCALIMSNDVRAEAAFPTLVNAILGDTGAPWSWEYSGMKFLSESPL